MKISFNHLCYIAITLVLLYGFGYSISLALNTWDNFVFDDDELKLYKWLNENTPKDSTVMTLSIDQNIKISTHAHNNIYFPNGLYSSWTTEEIIDRVLFLYDIYNVPDEELYNKLNVSNDAFRLEYLDKLYEGETFSLYDFEKYMFIHYPFHWQFFHGHWDYQQQNPDNPEWIGYYFPIEFRQWVMDKRHNQSYEIYSYDYILIGPYERQIADVDKIRREFKGIYSNEDFELFIIKC